MLRRFILLQNITINLHICQVYQIGSLIINLGMRKSIMKGKQLSKVMFSSPSSSDHLLKQSANHLKNMAQRQGLASLSSVQVHYNNSMLIILKPNLLKKDKWKGYNVKQTDYNCFINPEITHYSKEEDKVWQECPSYPRLKILISRSKSILVKYASSYKTLQQISQQKLKFESILFQHQINHLKCSNILKKAEQISLIQINKKDQNIQKQLQQIFSSYKQLRNNLEVHFNKNKLKLEIDRICTDAIEDSQQRAIAIDMKSKINSKFKQLQSLIQYQIIHPVQ